MSEAVENAQHDFWRPPAAPSEPAPAMVEVCDICETEFMVGARFCHVCGRVREREIATLEGQSWTRHLAFLRVLEFHNVKHWLGLPLASLIAFLIGLGCVLAAVAVGIIYSVQNFADFQAIQLWRMEWLLAAVASFVAAILLRSAGSDRSEKKLH
jgi:hypothetical protein